MSNHHHEICKNNEKKTLIVIIFTLIAMIAEIIYGYITNSMALLADGYHMSTHALALGLTYIAYILSRKFADSDLFKNGTDKIGTLAGYTSSLFLGFTGLWIIYEAILRLVNPLSIKFNEAILVAIIGLLVNSICILIMGKEHSHSECHEHHNEHDEEEHHKHEHKEDYNFKAAYFHILADALTSVLAIFALIAGKYLNFIYLDPIIGCLGGILILRWAKRLITDTVKILIDMKK